MIPGKIEKMIITVQNTVCYGTRDVVIHFSEPTDPLEASIILTKELKTWQKDTLLNITKIELK